MAVQFTACPPGLPDGIGTVRAETRGGTEGIKGGILLILKS